MGSTLRAALLIARNDLRRRVRNRSFVIQALIGPLALSLLISAAFAGGFGFDVNIGVVDEDSSELTGSITEGLLAGEAGGVSFLRIESRDEARALVDDQDVIGAALVLPQGFEASLAERHTQPIDLLLDEGSLVSNAVAQAVAGGIAARIDAGRLTVAGLLADGRPAPELATLRELDPAVEVDRTLPGDEVSPAALVAPGMGLLFLFFTMAVFARSLLEERRQRVLDRVRAAPVSIAAVLIAKALGVVALGVVSIGSLWVATTVLVGAAWGDPAGVIGVVLAATLAVAGIGGIIAGLARTEELADNLATMVAFTLGILGGSLVPLSELPEGMRTAALFTPNGWAQRAFATLSAGGGNLGDVLPEIGVLVAWGVASLAVAAWLLPRRLQVT